ncbi:MAG: iron-sulfur cluster insertion protein ErpA [Proteobacteria bacterium]|nr:iron-sulfur cluster insertion protein ErpA [Pseudomonadota bacterium]MBI3496002.1 iron-sulfur cluster insertion protein ErpA [Pseudomonadota bacterium]
MSETLLEDRPQCFNLTESAAKRIRFLAQQEGGATTLRLAVTGGGCSGFQYNFSFDDAVTGEDKLFERDGAAVVIDETSLELLAGSELDFVEDLVGAAFQVKNPNATSKCGCGSSFSV